MDYRIFCPKCGKQTIIESMGDSYGGGGLLVTAYCNNCDIYVLCEKDTYNERMVVKDNPKPKKNKKEDKYITQVELLNDEEGEEYIDLQLIKGNRVFDIQFYIEESNVMPSRVYNDFKDTVYTDGKVTFKLKQATFKPVKKKMTKEEIEKELGYKVDIVG